MAANEYFEDIFTEFYTSVISTNFLNNQDIVVLTNFFNLIADNKNLTQAQANYVIKLMEKYKNHFSTRQLNLNFRLQNATWKNPFRNLDMTKSIFVEKDKNDKLWLCLKHPYSLKEVFEKEVLKNNREDRSLWNPDDKVRKYNIYDLNLILVNEFAIRHGFNIDESFNHALADVEQIWNDAEYYAPACKIVNDEVVLQNATSSAQEYFDSRKLKELDHDLMLAKRMGYVLYGSTSKNLIHRVASYNTNYFWTDDFSKFFNLYKTVKKKVILIVSEDNHLKSWLESFVISAINNGVSKEEIKICFRSRNDEDPKFNEWVRASGLGGDLSEGRLLIFKKPAKWLIKEEDDVSIIVVNKSFPPMSNMSQTWIDNHYCVLYLSDVKPAVQKDRNIVDL
jgi:hypothetical protein